MSACAFFWLLGGFCAGSFYFIPRQLSTERTSHYLYVGRGGVSRDAVPMLGQGSGVLGVIGLSGVGIVAAPTRQILLLG